MGVALAASLVVTPAAGRAGIEAEARGLIALSYRPGIDEFLVAVMRPDGTLVGEHSWTGGLDSCCPSWSPDGRRIAFVGLGDRGGDVWTMNADGTQQRLLARNASEPAWSPGGATIALARSGALFLIQADGSNQRLLIRNGDSPSWSPDGRWLAFIRSNDIYAVRRNRTGLRRLTRTRARESFPAWSPSGRAIAYEHRYTEDGEGRLLVIPASGGRARLVVDDTSLSGAPAWSPDSRQLVFSRDGSIIYLVNADGSRLRRIFPRNGLCTSCSGPDWSRQ